MTMGAFPRDFLLKFKPELAQAESTDIASSATTRAPSDDEAGCLTVSLRPTTEPGVVEIVIRLKLAANEVAPSGTDRPNAEKVAAAPPV
jgi:hypothetical protein